jgi:hypothetical protein
VVSSVCVFATVKEKTVAGPNRSVGRFQGDSALGCYYQNGARYSMWLRVFTSHLWYCVMWKTTRHFMCGVRCVWLFGLCGVGWWVFF